MVTHAKLQDHSSILFFSQKSYVCLFLPFRYDGTKFHSGKLYLVTTCLVVGVAAAAAAAAVKSTSCKVFLCVVHYVHGPPKILL